MLTIQFDPSYPQGALEEAACLVGLLSDAFTSRRDVEFSDDALAGAMAVFGAVTTTMRRAMESLNRATPAASAAAAPSAPAIPPELAALAKEGMAHIRKAEARRAKPVPEAAATLMDGLVVTARTGRAPRLIECKSPAPAPAAAKRRRAA